MSVETCHHTHCVVEWEDDKTEYAVVHTQRAKIVNGSSLKIGCAVLFVGNSRDRRRGKVLYIGNKKDCITYGLDFEQTGVTLNLIAWSETPALREYIEETAKNSRTVTKTNRFCRTISSSSSSSMRNNNSSSKQRKINKNKENLNVDSRDNQEYRLPTPQASTRTILIPQHDLEDDGNESEEIGIVSQSIHTGEKRSDTAKSTKDDMNALLNENKALQEKVLSLENELLFERESSVRITNETCYNFLKSICAVYEKTKDENSKQMIELGSKLPCSAVDLKLARKANPSATINNLVKLCFKDVDLKTMSYAKLKDINSNLLENIYDYVRCVHAPTVIPQTMFSSTISLRCRHLREGEKHKNGGSTPASNDNRRHKRQKHNESSTTKKQTTMNDPFSSSDGDSNDKF